MPAGKEKRGLGCISAKPGTGPMPTFRHAILCCLLALPCIAQAADKQQEILWLAADIAPSMIREGPYASTGFLDLAMADMRKLLPEFRHTTVWANSKRQEQEMQSGSHACTVAMLRTPRREEFIYYSHPYLRILPVGMITLRSKMARFDAYRSVSGQVSLGKILADGIQQLGIAAGRAYGGNINATLDAPTLNDKHLVVRSGTDISAGLYDMLQRGRIDYQLGYAVEELHLFRSHPNQKPTVFIPLEEAGDMHEMYFACAKTPWGKEMVERMNRQFESKAFQRKMQANYEHWLNPEALKLYRASLKETP
jgi:uncharacterized protein (TIGR02285 family)